MLIFVDIDDTICHYESPHNNDYSKAIPYIDRIDKINSLYDKGDTIVYWTARGTISGIDWLDVTQNQLKRWGCKYHELRMKKPAYDLFIDDKNINSETFFSSANKILCIIPARSGSKSLPHKNIKCFNGKPLLAWSIEQAKQCRFSSQMKIIVSTDSESYAKIARKWGAEVPFLRPTEISDDLSTDYECIKHTIDWLCENENYNPDLILQLRPTQPCRKVEDINKCLELFIKKRNEFDSLRTVVPADKSPFKMYSISRNEELEPLFREVDNLKEPYNQCRQVLPTTYLHNGYIDILNTNILEKGTISGVKIYPYIMNQTDTIDIDTIEDWIRAEKSIA